MPVELRACDAAAGGNAGIGRQTEETFSGGGMSGSRNVVYDGRGRAVSSTLTVGGTSYPLQVSCDDADNVLSQVYPSGETVTNTYSGQGWLQKVATSGFGGVTLFDNASYTGVGGAYGELTGARLGGGTYAYGASYDLLDRATDLKTTVTSGGATLFEQRGPSMGWATC